MSRIEELRALFKDADPGDRKVIWPLLDDVAFLEERLRELKRLPMIKVHKSNPERQEATPAAKQYKEFMQSYVNAIKVLQRALAKEAAGSESALVKMLAEFDGDGD